ncbi:MAG: EAL domain-containing protein, partial [Rhodocyclaceae bacterium]|nr:EAL domain-containing protein [Rhodocyclaceae bacterium]
NPAMRRMAMVGDGEIIRDMRIRDFFTPADRVRLRREISDVMAGEGKWTGELPLLARDGRTIPALQHLFPVRDSGGQAVAVAGIVADLTETKAAETQLRLLAQVFAHSGEAILVTDEANRIIAVNEAFSRLTGYGEAEVLGQNPRMLAAGRLPTEDYRSMWQAIRDRGYWAGEIWDRRKDGSCYPKWLTISVLRDAEGSITHHIGSFTDISERKATEERIRHLAHHDSLTGLPNRYDLDGRLAQAVAAARRDGRTLAVMFIDLDRFKAINDRLGHKAGDALLVQVANRLRACVRDSDVIARLGGDEFVVVMTGVVGDPMQTVSTMADKIVSRLGRPYDIADEELTTTPSIGISLFPADGGDVDSLMRNADTAMYHAKAEGRNRFQFFDTAMNLAAGQRMHLEHGLRRALEEGRFVLHFQPRIALVDRCVVGVEALLRWADPERGLVQPADFLTVAEETGLMEPLGLWVLRTACRELRILRDGGLVDLVMAVNLSARQVRSATLVAEVAEALREYALPPSSLELEIPESVAMADPASVIDVLTRLRDLGITLSVDDFGTGYSSLPYLRRLPIHRLKLDRTIVAHVVDDPDSAAISAATAALARSLGLAVVAEGVETLPQCDHVAALGIEFAQGNHFGSPVDADRLRAAMKRAMPGAQSGLYC